MSSFRCFVQFCLIYLYMQFIYVYKYKLHTMAIGNPKKQAILLRKKVFAYTKKSTEMCVQNFRFARLYIPGSILLLNTQRSTKNDRMEKSSLLYIFKCSGSMCIIYIVMSRFKIGAKMHKISCVKFLLCFSFGFFLFFILTLLLILFFFVTYNICCVLFVALKMHLFPSSSVFLFTVQKQPVCVCVRYWKNFTTRLI